MTNDVKTENAAVPNVPRNIKKAAVIGAGAMGSTIAAHLTNAGVEVYLIDIVPKGAADRNMLAKNAVARMVKATPATDALNAGFMHPSNAKLITVGNREDNIQDAVKDADWIVEAIIEDLDKKRELFAEVDKYKKPGAIVSSNTSTIPLQKLTAGFSDDFKKNFLNTHFFNPPRFMRLIELIGGPDTRPEVMETMREFCDVKLGKEVVICKDRPAFIANRIGTYFLFRAVGAAVDQGMKIEDVDGVLGRPMGLPKEGVFGIIDMVGLGIIPHVTKSLHNALEPDDMFQKIYREEKLITEMLADGRWGRNSGKGGFYRMTKNEDGSRTLESIDLKTGKYRPKEESKLKSVDAGKKGPRATFETKDIGGKFAWEIMRDTLVYSLSLVPEVSDDIAAVDAAMREGYNWKYGPFELVEKIGKDWFEQQLTKEGIALPPVLKIAAGRPFYRVENGKDQRLSFDFAAGTAEYADIERPAGQLSLTELKRTRKPLLTNASASLWDIGDGVVCVEFHSKGNTMDPLIFKLLNDSMEMVNDSKGKYKAMVIYNEGKEFSLGANLGLAAVGFAAASAKPSDWIPGVGNGLLKTLRIPKSAADKINGSVKSVAAALDKAYANTAQNFISRKIENRVYRTLEEFIYQGQATYKALRYAPFPVVGAPAGMALGGGCEILLHCDSIQAHAETYMGLVETGVGLVPAWGGMARYMERVNDAKGFKGGPFPRARAAFETVMRPDLSVSNSGADAQRKLWLRPGDGISMNRDRLLFDAKAKALAMAPAYTPPKPATFRLPGDGSRHAFRMSIDDFYIKGDMTWHDVVVADAAAKIITGGDAHVGKVLSENDVLQLEREGILSLIHTDATRRRIMHTLATGKPLREAPLKEAKTLEEIRANRADITLPRRDPDGQPARGVDAMRLKMMASTTNLLYKLVPALRG
jgi:3-hydroxyacyl-CoA dehydrogenase